MENKTKKSKYPEGYIGRPKPMKTKTFQFHKPTKKTYIKAGILLVIAAFLTYIVIRLVNVEKIHELDFEFYAYDSEYEPDSYVLENDSLRFELDPSTTQFEVLQKSTGHVWYSNPQDVDSDPIALAKEKNNMKSTMLIKYSTSNGTDEIYDLYTNSVQRSFYNVEQDGDEVIVNYTIGQMEREYIFPLAIYEDELLEYEEDLSRSQINAINRAYHKYDIDNLKPADDEDELLAKYPDFINQPVYIVFENCQKYLKEQVESIFESIGYTYEDYLRHKEMYKEANIKEVPAFNLTVKYSLDDNNLVVDIPFENISYKSKYPLTQLSVLPYFGAAGTDDEGFIFVPEGSGSIINFNNGKTRQNSYYADSYGWDYATDRKAVIRETRTAFPVFGMAYEDSSFISYPVEGSEYAGFTAEISGKLGSYNYVRADYVMLHREQYEVTTRTISAQYSYEKGLPEEESIKQKYTFIDSGSYVDMAKEYGSYLLADADRVDNESIPVSVEIVGAVDKVQQFLGMPKVLAYPLTTFKESEAIVKQIDDMGIKNTSVKLSGFINDGIRQKILKKFKVIKKLGGSRGLKKFMKNTADTSATIYIDGAVQTQYRSGLFDGFYSYRDSARFASDKLCELREYSPIWYGKLASVPPYYLLNPKVRNKTTDVLAKNVRKYGANVSFRDNGYLLSADYNDDRRISRAEVRKMEQKKFEEIKEAGTAVMINGGNDYAVNSADIITNMTFHGSKYAILDAFVPFYQIALHGYKNFTGEPLNICAEKEQLILESAECGAGLNFVFMGANEKAIQETDFTNYFASDFNSYKDELKSIYEKYNADFEGISNCTITDHEYLSDSVTVTTFDNGTRVYVNFGYIDFDSESGELVPARNYVVSR